MTCGMFCCLLIPWFMGLPLLIYTYILCHRCDMHLVVCVLYTHGIKVSCCVVVYKFTLINSAASVGPLATFNVQ